MNRYFKKHLLLDLCCFLLINISENSVKLYDYIVSLPISEIDSI